SLFRLGYSLFSYEYRVVCKSKGNLISMSRKETPLDNAVIESFRFLLKKETLYNRDIKSLTEYIKIVHQWIKFYNTRRNKLKKKTLKKVSTFWGSFQNHSAF